jgi:hypothetical protein
MTNNMIGYIAEQSFYKKVLNLDIFSEIKYEDDLVKDYSWRFSSIDYLLIKEDGIIPVQIKYRRTRRREDRSVNNFIKSVDQLSSIYNKPILFGLWISRLRPFDDNESLLGTRNIRCVSHFEDMETLISKSIDHIIETCKK